MITFTRRFNAVLLGLCWSGFACWPLPALALPTQTLRVSASIVAGCLMRGGSGVLGTLDFGSHPGNTSGEVSTAMLTNTAFSLACSPGTTLSMSIDGGTHFNNGRYLQQVNGTARIPYLLFTDALHSAASAITVGQVLGIGYSNAAAIVLPVYGVVQMPGSSPSGTYTDTLTVTLSW